MKKSKKGCVRYEITNENYLEPIPHDTTDLFFHYDFNKPINHINLPSRVSFISFGQAFNQPVEFNNFPDAVQTLHFTHLQTPFTNLPPTIKHIYVYMTTNEILTKCRLCCDTRLQLHYIKEINGHEFPSY